MSRTAAVTGAYGYVGSVIRSRLDAAGWTTTALVRRPRFGDAAVAWSLGHEVPEQVLSQCDALVHCAYDFSVRGRHDVWGVNVDGSRLLIEEAKRVGVRRIIALSSMSAYAGTSQTYGLAKLAIEDIVITAGGVAVRPGLVYGTNPAGMAGALLKLTRAPLVPALAGGARQFPVHEDDLAEAILCVLEADHWVPEAFGIAQPASLSFGELLKSLAAADGRDCRLFYVPWQVVYWTLRVAEATRVPLTFRSDSILGLVSPADRVPRSAAFPEMLDKLRQLSPPVGR